MCRARWKAEIADRGSREMRAVSVTYDQRGLVVTDAARTLYLAWSQLVAEDLGGGLLVLRGGGLASQRVMLRAPELAAWVRVAT